MFFGRVFDAIAKLLVISYRLNKLSMLGQGRLSAERNFFHVLIDFSLSIGGERNLGQSDQETGEHKKFNCYVGLPEEPF